MNLKLIVCLTTVIIFSPTYLFANEGIEWSKLYNKKWIIQEVSIYKEGDLDSKQLIYSRGNSSRMDLDKVAIYFKNNGTIEGTHATGDVSTGIWEKEGDRSLSYSGDDVPSIISKLTNSELVLQIQQQRHHASQEGLDNIVTETKYVTFDTALPVSLMKFDASFLDNNDVLLIWKTDSEKNSDYFQIEYSSDATNFGSIGRDSSLVSSDSEQTYSFIHKNVPPSKIHYYRLKMVDKDGSFTYSTIKALKGKFLAINVYPNPTSNELTIEEKNWDKVQEVQLLTTSGKIIHKFAPVSSNKLNLSAIPTGAYIVLIQYRDGGQIAHRVVKN